jgi:hypothetical protein
MLGWLRTLLARKPTRPEAPRRVIPPAPKAVHIFTCAFDTHQGFVNYVDQIWTTQDAEPRCHFEDDLQLAYLDRNYVELVEGTPDEIDAHIRPLLKHSVDADAVFLGTPRVDQAVLIYDNALPDDAPPLRSTAQARYVGEAELS